MLYICSHLCMLYVCSTHFKQLTQDPAGITVCIFYNIYTYTFIYIYIYVSVINRRAGIFSCAVMLHYLHCLLTCFTSSLYLLTCFAYFTYSLTLLTYLSFYITYSLYSLYLLYLLTLLTHLLTHLL